MEISQIITYPVKSLAGIKQKKALLYPRGLQYDRRWMLINENGRFITQREFPRMAQFRPMLTDDHLLVYAPEQMENPIEIPLTSPKEQPAKMVQIWNDTVMAITMDSTIDEWFTDWLKTPCRLVYMPDESKRPLNPAFELPNGKLSFSDGGPILVVGEASLRDLNARLKEPLLMERFRPNLVFNDGVPYEEEHWKGFQINDEDFKALKPCVRCKITTIDQQTAEVGKEPLQTLSTYKKGEKGITFGLLASWQFPEEETEETAVEIKVGDSIVPFTEEEQE